MINPEYVPQWFRVQVSEPVIYHLGTSFDEIHYFRSGQCEYVMKVCPAGMQTKPQFAFMSYDGLFCDIYEFLVLLLRPLEDVNNFLE